MLFHPVLMGLIAALVIGLALSFALGLWRSDKQQAAAGMVALCGLKWRDFAHLVEDVLQERGFSRAPEERNLGDGGFDLLMARGSSRYLVQCKNGAAHRVTDQGIRDLATQVESHGAEGAVLATSGGVEASARLLASNRRIEILADEDLWRQVRSFLPHDVREEVLVRSRAERLKRSIATGVGICRIVLDQEHAAHRKPGCRRRKAAICSRQRRLPPPGLRTTCIVLRHAQCAFSSPLATAESGNSSNAVFMLALVSTTLVGLRRAIALSTAAKMPRRVAIRLGRSMIALTIRSPASSGLNVGTLSYILVGAIIGGLHQRHVDRGEGMPLPDNSPWAQRLKASSAAFEAT
jgi:hypothetical protein